MNDEQQPPALAFPQIFPIKIIGISSGGFKAKVEEVIAKTVDGYLPEKTIVEYSRTKKYASVNVEVVMQSMEEFERLHKSLAAMEEVKVVL